jgi:hypothetical protein
MTRGTLDVSFVLQVGYDTTTRKAYETNIQGFLTSFTRYM